MIQSTPEFHLPNRLHCPNPRGQREHTYSNPDQAETNPTPKAQHFFWWHLALVGSKLAKLLTGVRVPCGSFLHSVVRGGARFGCHVVPMGGTNIIIVRVGI